MSTGLDLWPSRPWLPTGQGGAQRAGTPSLGGSQGGVHRLELSAAADVHRFVARRVANHADAEDIAQQTLLLAWAKRSTCRGENLSPWLFAIARHLIVDHYRAKTRVHFVDVSLAALAETEPALRTPRDAVLTACECRARLSGWLECITRRLRLEEQLAVLLADIYGHRDKESAALLHMSVPSFKLLLHGARARLQQIAGGKCNVVEKTNSGAACDKAANGHCHENLGCGNGGPRCAQATYRLGVTCRRGASKLLALRNKLLEGLRTLLVVLSALDPLWALIS